MSASGPPPALPAARSPAGETRFLVDAHVHLHPCFDRADFLDGALSSFERAAGERGLPPGWRACLLFAETRGETLFHEARQGPIASPGRGWEIEPAGEPDTLVARRPWRERDHPHERPPAP